MVLDNLLNLTNQAELNQAEERISKRHAKHLFESGEIDAIPVGTFAGLAAIHTALFSEIYPFAGQRRTVNLAKGNFRFASVMYLDQALVAIDGMPHGTFDEIVDKYVEMNIAHPFREGNGRATRLWLDGMLKQAVQQVVDWNLVDKEAYLSSMERSVVNALELKTLLKTALTPDVNNRMLFMKGLDVSYYYEGYTHFRTEDL